MEAEEVDEQQVETGVLDAGSGTECLQLGSDWVEYLAQAELPSNVTGVNYDIPDFEEWTSV